MYPMYYSLILPKPGLNLPCWDGVEKCMRSYVITLSNTWSYFSHMRALKAHNTNTLSYLHSHVKELWFFSIKSIWRWERIENDYDFTSQSTQSYYGTWKIMKLTIWIWIIWIGYKKMTEISVAYQNIRSIFRDNWKWLLFYVIANMAVP